MLNIDLSVHHFRAASRYLSKIHCALPSEDHVPDKSPSNGYAELLFLTDKLLVSGVGHGEPCRARVDRRDYPADK